MPKNIVFSIYIKNPEPNLSEKQQFIKTKLAKHYQRLLDVKKEYAKHCNAEFRLYHNYVQDTYWQNFKKKFKGERFHIIYNQYKIHIWEELGKEGYNVLYLDFDVIPNSTESFFEKFDMNKMSVYKDDDKQVKVISGKMIHLINKRFEELWKVL